MIPQRPIPVRPIPKRLGKTKFSEQKFRDCLHQLYGNGVAARTQQIDEFIASRGQGDPKTQGKYAIMYDYSMIAVQIEAYMKQRGYSPARPIIAFYDNGTPDRIYFAKDVFPERRGGVLGTGQYGAAVLFHEIGNWFGYGIVRDEPDRRSLNGGGYAQRNPSDPWADSDRGAALEECMYGGFVHADGYVWNVPRGAL